MSENIYEKAQVLLMNGKLITNYFLIGIVVIFCATMHAYTDGEEIGRHEFGEEIITLKYRDPTKLLESRSNLIGTNYGKLGEQGDVHLIGDEKVVKFIEWPNFNFNEIITLKIAGKIKVGPEYFDAWVTETDRHKGVLFVAIKMSSIEGKTLASYEAKQIRDFGEKEHAKLQSLYSKKKDGKTYFFDRIFSMLLSLAENKVSYVDLHRGNIIIPYSSWRETMLVDFGGAQIHDTKKEAAKRTIDAPFVKPWIDMFEELNPEFKGKIAKESLKKLKDLSSESP